MTKYKKHKVHSNIPTLIWSKGDKKIHNEERTVLLLESHNSMVAEISSRGLLVGGINLFKGGMYHWCPPPPLLNRVFLLQKTQTRCL